MARHRSSSSRGAWPTPASPGTRGELEAFARSFESRHGGGRDDAGEAQAALERYGFGISTEDELTAESQWSIPTLPGQASNESVTAALSLQERAAYNESFQRCVSRSATEVAMPEALQAASDPRWTQFQIAVAELVANDPRTIAATQAWRACMAAAGFDFPDRDALMASIRDRADAAKAGGSEPLATVQQYERQAAKANAPCEAPAIAVNQQVRQEHLDRLSQGG